MFNSPFFESIISMVTLYLIFSQLTLSLVELVSGPLNTRGNFLHRHLGEALGAAIRDAFYDAAAIRALMGPATEQNPVMRWRGVSRWPAYVSEPLFAQVIIGYVSSLGGTAPAGIAQFEAGLSALNSASPANGASTLAAAQAAAAVPGATAQDVAAAIATTAPAYLLAVAKAATQRPGASAQTVASAVKHATANLAETKQFADLLLPLYQNAATVPDAEQSQRLQKNLEAWFHEFGERMTGWYKRDKRKWLFLAGLLVAVLADVDTVRLARFISDSANAKARAGLVTAGVAATRQAAPAVLVYNPTDTAKAAKEKQTQQGGSAATRTHQQPTNKQPQPDNSVAMPANQQPANKQPQQVDSVFAQAYRQLKETLDAVPLAGLPLGLGRWWNWETRCTKYSRQDLAKLPAAVAARLMPCAKASSTDSVCLYEWAPTADDYRLPVYAQRWRLNPCDGKSKPMNGNWTWAYMAGGWLLTAFALMLGAPFWFDTLCRFVNIRNVGIKPAKAATNA